MADEIFDQDRQLHNVLQQVAGQLKGSLGNIHSALERLAPAAERDRDPELDRDAAVLCQSYYRVLRLANNLADAANLDGPNRARLRNDDIVGFCRTVVRRAEQPAALLGLTVLFQCEKASHIIAMDADRLERLILNLLSNAFKFTPRGGTVTLEVRILPQRVELRLTDTGRGMSPEQLEHAFDRYQQTGRMDPPPYGLGLGLPICRRIAQEHEGSILLTSPAGAGVTVTVSLPNRRSAVQELNTLLFDYAGGFNRTLLELSDALPKMAFTQKYLD